MSVLIRGMEMPKDGVYWCEIGVADEIATITIHGEDRKSFHLVPIQSHGRLIDADKLEQDAQKRLLICDKNNNQFQKPYEIIRAIALAPTVIPAEPKKENE